ncbi:hypothetical protein K0U91_07965 [Chryseobacterium chendengshani]|uniref:hypothetical protein n=1 Tax=Chryseobacterium sp. LJ668 TaxID=2864040 RepID=UPI001C68A8A9|nr:hypothetical protein [Chryseobacterium sp. LJ668]MBW8522407.1 hypothetical protein [Chryseobacterium sp. LJ668]QYK18046.1 hypothetical protein K0U91_07965 [Chryseobacterium sp. LJ668]
MKTFFTLILNLFLGINVFATSQYPDKIIYNGKEYDLLSNPLNAYFEKHPDRIPKGGVMSSALWRGYVATFEIKDNQLFLRDIKIQYHDTTSKDNYPYKWRSIFKEVFPDQKDVKIDWLTGLLVVPHGEIVNYVHMGYGSTYENYILLEINTGDLKKEKRYNYKEYEKFKEKQFQGFKQTDYYKKIKTDLQKDGSSEEFVDSFLKNFVTEYTSKILTE